MNSGTPVTNTIKHLFAAACFACAVSWLAGCSAGKEGLLSITPQQYFYSAKEKLEIIDERAFETKDLDEIIRVLENAEKNAQKSEIMDKSRMYLTLANVLKARKQFKDNRLKGQYVANRAEPFYVLDLKPMQETLRTAKKWLRLCKAQFKTNSLAADLNYVEGLFYMHKMLTQRGRERTESLWTAVRSFRLCLGIAPDYKSDFRLFGKIQTTREVRLKLIETLALGGEAAEAYAILADYQFSSLPPTAGAAIREDFPWLHMKGLVLAVMGRYLDAAATLDVFKIISPRDYPTVEEALWVLEGVYDRLKDETRDDRYGMEARIVASLLKKLKGPYSKEKYTTASHVFPKWMPGDKTFFEALIEFHKGDFDAARTLVEPLARGGIISRANRAAARILALETDLYAGVKITDEIIEELTAVTFERDLTPLMKERVGFLLARYIAGRDSDFKAGLLEAESQTFVRSILEKPWALSLQYKRGKIARDTARTTERKSTESRKPVKDESVEERENASIKAEVFVNRSEDWIVSATLNLIALPQMSLLGKGRIVGREEDQHWIFKGEDVDEMRRGGLYLAMFEFDNSDNEKSIQGVIFRP